MSLIPSEQELLTEFNGRISSENMEKQSGWIVPTFENSWVNYVAGFATAGFFKDTLGFVHLRGLVKNGTVNTIIFTLPVGYRPALNLIYATVASNTFARITVYTNGEVKQAVGDNGFQSLDGIIFKAEA